MDKLLLLRVLFAFAVGLQVRETAAQRSRVCFAQSGDYTGNTALGFCSQGIYLAFKPTPSGAVAFINEPNDGNAMTGGIAKFIARKTTYPYLEVYLGLVATVANELNWMTRASNRASFIDNLRTRLRSYPQITGVYVDFEPQTRFEAEDYGFFILNLRTALAADGLRLATALPYDAIANADLYYSDTLKNLPFNVLKTYEDMYATSTTVTHPLSPLYPLAAPFNVGSKVTSFNIFRWIFKGLDPTNLVLGLPMYSVKFTVAGVSAFGGAATAVVRDTYCNALRFGSTNTVGPVSAGESFAYGGTTFYSYNSFAAVNEKLSLLLFTNLAGAALFSLDQAGSANAEMLRYATSVLAPTPPTGFSYPPASAATCGVPIGFPVPPATTTTTTPTTTTTTTPTTTTTTTTPTTTTTTTTPTTTTTTTTPTTTTTTTTPTTTTTTTTPTTTTTTTTPTTTTTTTPSTTPTTAGTTPSGPVSAVICGVPVIAHYGDLVADYCSNLAPVSNYLLTAGMCGRVV